MRISWSSRVQDTPSTWRNRKSSTSFWRHSSLICSLLQQACHRIPKVRNALQKREQAIMVVIQRQGQQPQRMLLHKHRLIVPRTSTGHLINSLVYDPFVTLRCIDLEGIPPRCKEKNQFWIVYETTSSILLLTHVMSWHSNPWRFTAAFTPQAQTIWEKDSMSKEQR